MCLGVRSVTLPVAGFDVVHTIVNPVSEIFDTITSAGTMDSEAEEGFRPYHSNSAITVLTSMTTNRRPRMVGIRKGR